MSRSNIAYHSLRLNLTNEQHYRVQKTLCDLNVVIHKSVNQFIIDAIDHYVQALDAGDFRKAEMNVERDPYIKKEDFNDLCREIKDEVKDEMIRLLGSALAGRMNDRVSPVDRMEPEPVSDDIGMAMEGFANEWG